MVSQFSQELDKYFKSAGFSKKTTANYISDINQFINWYKTNFPKDRNLANISSQMIESYKTLLLQGNVPKSTINRRLSALRQFSNFLTLKSKIKKDFMKAVSNVSLINSADSFPTKKLNNIYAYLIIVIIAFLIFGVWQQSKFEALNKDIAYTISANPKTLSVPFKVSNDNLKVTVDEAPTQPNDLKSQDIAAKDLALNLPSANQNNIISNSPIAGQSAIIVGKTEQKIDNSNVSKSSLIFVTPISNPQGQILYIREQNSGYFVVGIDKRIDHPILFNWWVR